jgi:4-hydroxyphenylpyruvate dioxygenase-like putative hemolysin
VHRVESGQTGGVAYIIDSNVTVSNSVFEHGNAATGAGFHVEDSELAVVNCTFTGNTVRPHICMHTLSAASQHVLTVLRLCTRLPVQRSC